MKLQFVAYDSILILKNKFIIQLTFT